MRTAIRIASVIGAMLMLGGVAFGQIGSGGLRANDTSTAEPARMHDPGVTPNIMVDGQNPEGAPARQSFMSWQDACALGRKHYAQQHQPESLGDVARRYRKPVVKFENGRYSCPQGWDVNGSEPEALGGDSDYVHCTKATVVRP